MKRFVVGEDRNQACWRVSALPRGVLWCCRVKVIPDLGVHSADARLLTIGYHVGGGYTQPAPEA